MAVLTLMNQIKQKEIVLPAIQRDFVWETDQIESLLDSIMRGYPIGIVLLWETYNDIQYRKFVEDYHSETLYTFSDNSNHQRLRLVLDGQQRLQSLYIALYGTLDGKELFFDVLSGETANDLSSERFIFRFANPKEIVSLNKKSRNGRQYFIRLKDIFSKSITEKTRLASSIKKDLKLNEDEFERLDINLRLIDNRLSVDTNIIKVMTIDENLPPDTQDRKAESDIVEIFVRINQEGTQLSRSDLILSMIKLNWKESTEALPKFVADINKGNSFEIDTDFVVRCLFAVSDLGTRFDVDLLRNTSNVEKIKNNFEPCSLAIRSTVDFIQKYCSVSNSKVLGGYNHFIPVVYYLFHLPKHLAPNDQIDAIRKSLFLLGFSRPFSRYADSRLWKFIREPIKESLNTKKRIFPFGDLVWWVNHWEGVEGFNDELLNGNILLVHYLVQGMANVETKYDRNNPEHDHIFPRSILRTKKFNEAEINHYANFWLLEEGKNQNKSNTHPRKYFKDYTSKELKRYFIDPDLLDYPYYKKFLSQRSEQIRSFLTTKLGFNENDFEV